MTWFRPGRSGQTSTGTSNTGTSRSSAIQTSTKSMCWFYYANWECCLAEFRSVYTRVYMETKIAKLFKNGSSQAVRLPSEFRFAGSEVYATRDEVTGEVVLSDRPGSNVWHDFFEFMRCVDVPADYMCDRPMNRPPLNRDVFSENE